MHASIIKSQKSHATHADEQTTRTRVQRCQHPKSITGQGQAHLQVAVQCGSALD
jgi:hypothetical protein